MRTACFGGAERIEIREAGRPTPGAALLRGVLFARSHRELEWRRAVIWNVVTG